MEPELHLSAQNHSLSLWLESKGQSLYLTTSVSFPGRNSAQSPCPLCQAPGGGTGLRSSNVATALSKKVWGLGLLKRQQVERFSAQQHRRLFFTSLLLGVCLVGVALLHVWLRLQVVHLGYVLSSTSKLHSQLEQENRELKVELATVTSPSRLEVMARTRLGLVEPEKGQVVLLP